MRVVDKKSSRVIEMQQAVLIIGAILVLCFAFYVGKKFDYWRYVLMTKTKPKLMEKTVDKFPNSSADELLEQALTAEHRGDWRDAIERFIAAKHKNLAYRGILFHAARLSYDKGDFDNADKLFERAIAFHENVDTANYFRGLIATRHRDLPAAERFFEAAATADPLRRTIITTGRKRCASITIHRKRFRVMNRRNVERAASRIHSSANSRSAWRDWKRAKWTS